MHLFSDYVQPFTLWLHDHPHWALFITFVISFAESLAIIGSIIPGSLTMTAIGILAGSGIMRIDLTLSAATLGAIVGDSASYMLGYTFRDRLVYSWPFKRYPNWLFYGKEYFARHGGKSVLIGRFVGPLRSIIPLIAGMMHMSQWRFFIVNIISGVAWAILYVLPGILIGAASSDLSPEQATFLFGLILVFLAAIWLFSIVLKWLVRRVNRMLRLSLNYLWLWSAKHPSLMAIVRFLTPAYEEQYYPTATLVILLLFVLLSFSILTGFMIQAEPVAALNQTIYLFLQSLRTHWFDVFFIVISQLISPLSLLAMGLTVTTIALYYHDRRTLTYWISLNINCVVFLFFLHLVIDSSKPQELLDIKGENSYPLSTLTLATALFSAFILYINTYYKTYLSRLIKLVLTSLLILAGIAPIYLGDNWFTDCLGAYLMGLGLCLSYWLFYRRSRATIVCSEVISILIILALFVASSLSNVLTFEQAVRTHRPSFAQYVFTDTIWWNQSKPLLPLYHTNRIGRNISIFNIQYVGSLNHLERALTDFGWQKQNVSLLSSIVKRLNGRRSAQELPLLAQLYINRRPALVMTYRPNNNAPIQILRLWRSNYHLKHFNQPIWLGVVVPYIKHQSKWLEASPSLGYVSASLPQFLQRRIPLPAQVTKSLPIKIESMLLLIKEPAP